MALIFSLIVLTTSIEAPVQQLIVHAMCVQEKEGNNATVPDLWVAPDEYRDMESNLPEGEDKISLLWKQQLDSLKTKNRLINICPKQNGQAWQYGLIKPKD